MVLIASITGSTVVDTASFTATVAYASEAPVEAPEPVVESIHAKISRIAAEEKVSSTTVSRLVKSESEFNPTAVGDGGCSLGLVQINLCARPTVKKEEALDPDFAIRYFAQALSKGEEYAWTPCNCYSYVKAYFIKKLPKMADIVPNSAPKKGGVIILKYQSLKHIAYITDMDEDGVYVKEANYRKCATGKRYIRFDDPYLIGFWSGDLQE